MINRLRAKFNIFNGTWKGNWDKKCLNYPSSIEIRLTTIARSVAGTKKKSIQNVPADIRGG